jgi:hypothetical protein
MTPVPDTPALLSGIRERNASPGDAAGFVRSARDVPFLLAAIEALTSALTRHRPWFVNDAGVRICGGCLDPAPCKDDPDVIVSRALSGKDGTDE